jgi:hypothetical protein
MIPYGHPVYTAESHKKVESWRAWSGEGSDRNDCLSGSDSHGQGEAEPPIIEPLIKLLHRSDKVLQTPKLHLSSAIMRAA